MTGDNPVLQQNTMAPKHSLNMHEHFDRAKDFYEALDLEVKEGPDLTNDHVNQMVLQLAQRSVHNLERALDSGVEEKVFYELVRQLDDLSTRCLLLGYDLPTVIQGWKRRLEANMSKLDHDGKSLGFDDRGKVINGPNYERPDYASLLKPKIEPGPQTGVDDTV